MPSAKLKELARKDKPYRGFLEAIPREQLMDALGTATDQRFTLMLSCMMDPAYKQNSLVNLAKKFNISMTDFLKHIRDYQQGEGLGRMMLHFPDVMEDAAIDAKAKLVLCKRCEGEGSKDGKECGACDGSGRVRRPGDKEARRFVGEATGITGRKGPLVAQQFNIGGGDSLEDTVAITEKLLKGRTIDVEAG